MSKEFSVAFTIHRVSFSDLSQHRASQAILGETPLTAWRIPRAHAAGSRANGYGGWSS